MATEPTGPAQASYDVIVVGSGAGGLTAATVAALRGARVLLLEKAATFGGTTARSGARLWIPCSPQAAAAGVADSLDAARAYIRHEAGEDFDPALVDAFLRNGPEMVAFLEAKTRVRFLLDTEHSPDYSLEAPGAAPGGRTIGPAEFDPAELGAAWTSIAPFRRWGTFLGIQIGAGDEAAHFMKAARSLRSFLFVAREIVRHFFSVTFTGRPAVLRDGNALIGRLLASAMDAGVEMVAEAAVIDILKDGARVCGVLVDHGGRLRRIDATRGVVLATGGVGHNCLLRGRLFDHVGQGAAHRSAAAPDTSGDGLAMAERAGASLRSFGGWRNGAWAPMLRDPRVAGTDSHIPSFTRAVPGTVVVSRAGRRIGNEAEYYPDFTQHMFRLFRDDPESGGACFIVGDRTAMRRYGFGTGVIRPFPFPLGPHLRSGLLARADTLDELAARVGIDAAGLGLTVRANNAYADSGRDAEFGRGERATTPGRRNPFLGRIETPPYYALRLVAGDIGSFAGIRTDRNANALGADGQPVRGLYAVGNDMASAFGGDYPGKGGTIGPAMTFAYIAACDLAATDDR